MSAKAKALLINFNHMISIFGNRVFPTSDGWGIYLKEIHILPYIVKSIDPSDVLFIRVGIIPASI